MLWVALPMEHSNLENSIGFWYVAPNVSTMTLLMMQKAPLLIFDAATALMIGRIVAAYHSAQAAQQAVLLWLINPYVTGRLVVTASSSYPTTIKSSSTTQIFCCLSVSLSVGGT